MGAGLHDTALHHGKNELRELIEVGAGREAMGGIAEASADGGGPAVKVGRDLVMNFSAPGVDFKRKASDRTSEGKTGHQDFLAIAVKQNKDALDWVLGSSVYGAENDRLKIRQVPVQNSVQQLLFTLEEEVKTAAVGARFLQYLSHAGGLISLRVEEFDGGEDDAVAGRGSETWHDSGD